MNDRTGPRAISQDRNRLALCTCAQAGKKVGACSGAVDATCATVGAEGRRTKFGSDDDNFEPSAAQKLGNNAPMNSYYMRKLAGCGRIHRYRRILCEKGRRSDALDLPQWDLLQRADCGDGA